MPSAASMQVDVEAAQAVQFAPRRMEPELLSPADPTLFCPLCKQLLKGPMRTACGHTCCGDCLQQLIATSSDAGCPECDAPLCGTRFPLQPDRFAERIVGALQCFCPMRSEGCPWIGTRSQVESHLKDCRAAICVQCTPEGADDTLDCRANAGGCSPCATPSMVQCPWGCGEHIMSGQYGLDEHRDICPREPRRLLATVQRLQILNQQLALENQRLKRGPPSPLPRERLKASQGPGMCMD